MVVPLWRITEGTALRTSDRGGVNRERLIVLLLFAAAWCIWLYRLGINDLGDGEANELIFARAPLLTILLDAKWSDQSPLYFALLHS